MVKRLGKEIARDMGWRSGSLNIIVFPFLFSFLSRASAKREESKGKKARKTKMIKTSRASARTKLI